MPGSANGYVQLLHAYSHFQRRRLAAAAAAGELTDELLGAVRASRDSTGSSVVPTVAVPFFLCVCAFALF